jgi:blue copper oxidase
MSPASIRRRDFVRIAAGSVGLITAGGLAALTACDRSPTGIDRDDQGRLLRQPGSASAAGLSLLAAPGSMAAGGSAEAAAWLFNGSSPGPTIRARLGEDARITLYNNLPEETIVHWHGLIVPEEADGHPRHAIPSGASYDYAFPVQQRALTAWYHPHAHHRTAAQVHMGLAGFFIVSDEEEDALQLPDGPREILLMIQDRRVDGGASFDYSPSGDDLLTGMLGDTVFCNGTTAARLPVTADTYRFRILNASQARVYQLALSTGTPLTVIGNDGGLLPAAAEVESVYLGVGERVDLLADFSRLEVGRRLMLKSLPFSTPVSSGPFPQGMELDVLELEVVGGTRSEGVVLPGTLSAVQQLPAGAAAGARTFEFTSPGGSHHGTHRINDSSFDMLRVDEQIPLGRLERWVFLNNSAIPHPVHLHGTHFQLLGRSGGRSTIYPYERGWKDTVLLMPGEEVEALVRFDAYRGIFPLHCHNLQHEDLGMMLNVEVV